jgi:hypothetical protein
MRERKEKAAEVPVSAMTQLGDRAAGRRRVTVRAFLARAVDLMLRCMKRKAS